MAVCIHHYGVTDSLSSAKRTEPMRLAALSLMTLAAVALVAVAQQPQQGKDRGGKPNIELPKQADFWKEIGTYEVKEKDTTVKVKVYSVDTDDSAFLGGSYPNSFSLHAVYQVGDGPWQYKKLYAVGRVGFHKVLEVKPDAVKFQVRSKLMILMDGDDSLQLDEKQLEEIYRPRTKTLSVKKGVPVLE